MGLKITVLGAGREVGRAAVLLEGGNGDTLLLDYGVAFDETDVPVFPLSVKPSKLKAIAVTHAHLDHVGAVPMLFVSVRKPVVMTELTMEFAKLLIEDMMRLAGYYLPFEHPELETMLANTKTVSIGSEVWIDGVKMEFINAGHIPGSTMVKIDIDGTSVLYTGDVNTIDTRLVKGADLSGVEANVMIIESTYGNVDHPDRREVEEKFIDAVKSVIEDGGNVLIPAFALGRSQEILALLAERMPYAEVYYDGMSRRMMDLMLSYPKYINRIDLLRKAAQIFTPVQGTGMRRKILRERGAIIVTPAGMLKGGPSMYYIKRLWDDKKSAVFLVSYQAPSTPGRKLLNEGVIEEGTSKIKAKLFWFDFSSHAGASGLMKLVKQVKGLEKVIVIHGNDAVAYELAYRIREEVGVDVSVPANGDTIEV
ncbi:MAG: MBL fold metallo-hydrolase [Crenarchaeota archaeon]|nr:MBL fold metallo-hydrolase [Thermoproteota archaeon]